MSAANNNNVNNSFFDGQYKDVWRLYIPEELTNNELDFIRRYFNLQPNDSILDIMCGFGRHSIGLARHGMRVTAVDNLKDYIDEIKTTAAVENLELKAVQSDILDFQPLEKYDLAICMGNSLNFFNEQDCLQVMNSIAGSLNPGSHFFIHTWSLAESIIKNFVDKSWSYNGDYKLLNDSVFLFNPTRIETEFTMIDKDGNAEVKEAVDYIFSYSEMQKMLEQSGFHLKEVFSIPGKRHFTVGEPRAYFIAQKI